MRVKKMEHNRWSEFFEGIEKFGAIILYYILNSLLEFMSKIFHVDLTGIPLPRPMSIYLFAIFSCFTIAYHISHAELNAYGASLTTIFAIIRYGHDFIKWSMVKYDDHKKNKKPK